MAKRAERKLKTNHPKSVSPVEAPLSGETLNAQNDDGNSSENLELFLQKTREEQSSKDRKIDIQAYQYLDEESLAYTSSRPSSLKELRQLELLYLKGEFS